MIDIKDRIMGVSTFELRYKKSVGILGMIFSLLFGIPALVLAVSFCLNGEYSVAAIVLLSLGGLASLGIILWLSWHNYRFTVEGGECCLTTTFGRQKRFLLSEVAHAIPIMQGAVCYIQLLDKDAKLLYRAEPNLENFSLLLDLLTERNLVDLDAPVTMPNATWDETRWEYRHRKGLKWMLCGVSLVVFAMSAGSVFLFAAGQARWSAIVLTLAPLLLCGCYLCFPHVIVWDKPNYAPPEWRKAHLTFPIVPFMLWGLFTLMFMSIFFSIVFVTLWQPLVFGVVLFALFFTLHFLRTPKSRRTTGPVLVILIVSLMFSFPATTLLNFGLRFAPLAHQEAVVTDTELYTDSDDDTDYRVTVSYSGKDYDFSTTEKLYTMAQSGMPLELCIRKNIFGISYLMLHLPENTE